MQFKSSFNWIETAKRCKAFSSHTHSHTQMGVRKSRAVTQAYRRSDRQRKSLTEGYRVGVGVHGEACVRVCVCVRKSDEMSHRCDVICWYCLSLVRWSDD